MRCLESIYLLELFLHLFVKFPKEGVSIVWNFPEPEAPPRNKLLLPVEGIENLAVTSPVLFTVDRAEVLSSSFPVRPISDTGEER